MTTPRKAFNEINLILSPTSTHMGYRDNTPIKSSNGIDSDRLIQLEKTGEVESCFLTPEKTANDAKILSPIALARLITYAIELKGPTRIGEIGKFLQLATGNEGIVLFIKMQLKGLKNLLLGFSSLFRLGNDHPFNPTVYLSDSYISKMNTLRAQAQEELQPFYSYDSGIFQQFPIAGVTCPVSQDGERPSDLSDATGTTRSRSRSNSTEGLDGAVSSPTRLNGTDESHTEYGTHLQASAEALAQNIVLILEERGPMPVGEIGKFLQLYTASGSEMSHYIKAQFRGLRKLIAGFRRLFTMDQSHPFNPCVHLSAEYMSYSNAERSTLDLSPLFVFEPVSTVLSPTSDCDKFSASSSNTNALLKTSQKNSTNKQKKSKKSSPAGKSKGVQGKPNNGQPQHWTGLCGDGQQGAEGFMQHCNMNLQYYSYGQQCSINDPHSTYSEEYPVLTSSTRHSSGEATASLYSSAVENGWLGTSRDRSQALECDPSTNNTAPPPSSWGAYKASINSTVEVPIPHADTSNRDSCVSCLEPYFAGMRIPDQTFVGSPDDSKQMMCMSPSYIRHSHILNMLDIE